MITTSQGQVTSASNERVVIPVVNNFTEALRRQRSNDAPDLAEFYMNNIGSQILQATVWTLQTPSRILQVQAEKVSRNFCWNSTGFNANESMYFAPIPAESRYLAFNRGERGRFTDVGAKSIPRETMTIEDSNGRFVFRGSIKGVGIQEHPALILQRPEFVCVKQSETKDFVSLRVNGLSANLLVASFGIVITMDDRYGNREILEVQVLLYPNKVLLAKRTLTLGVPSDCASNSWVDTLELLETGRLNSTLFTSSTGAYNLIRGIEVMAYPNMLLDDCCNITDNLGERLERFVNYINQVVEINYGKDFFKAGSDHSKLKNQESVLITNEPIRELAGFDQNQHFSGYYAISTRSAHTGLK